MYRPLFFWTHGLNLNPPPEERAGEKQSSLGKYPLCYEKEDFESRTSFCVRALLRYNSCTIQFTYLSYNSLVSSISTELCSRHHSQLGSSFLTAKRNPLPIFGHCPFLPKQPGSSPRWPVMYFLFLWRCLFWTLHMKGIIHSVVLRQWFLSRSIVSAETYML